MELASALSLAAFVALNLLAASTGALFRPGDWYESLERPWWRPPNWLFGPAWAVLYTMIAISGWLVWERVGWGPAILIYLISLGFNAGWSAIFFGLRRIDLAFGWIVAFWLSIVATIAVFAPVSATAAWLLAPYLVWVSFASALNFAMWRMNRTEVEG